MLYRYKLACNMCNLIVLIYDHLTHIALHNIGVGTMGAMGAVAPTKINLLYGGIYSACTMLLH